MKIFGAPSLMATYESLKIKYLKISEFCLNLCARPKVNDLLLCLQKGRHGPKKTGAMFCCGAFTNNGSIGALLCC